MLPTQPDSHRNEGQPLARSALSRFLYRCLAVIALLLAVAGAILPGLPCTEFVLLATWAAAKSSPRLHQWILRHRVFGPLLTQWQQGKMPRKAKWVSTVAMAVSGTIMALTVPHLPSVIATLLIMSVVLLWLWRRPEH